MILPKTRKEAKILGSSWYYTGKLCLNNHDSKRKTVNGVCYACALKNTSKWLKDRPEYSKNRAKKWQEENHEKHKAQHSKRCKKYNEANKQAVYETHKKYRQANRAKILSWTRKRQANKINATPLWLNNEHLKQIECKYSVAEMLNKHGVEKYQVDHIIPLQNKAVCGLHVPWNLQVITATENRKKGNKLINEPRQEQR
jgi:5-methylcytosine-specific restriction endonuclease McrA